MTPLSKLSAIPVNHLFKTQLAHYTDPGQQVDSRKHPKDKHLTELFRGSPVTLFL